MGNNNEIKIILIEDDRGDYILIKKMLGNIHNQSYKLEWVNNANKAINMLGQSDFDVCLVDYRLGDINGLDVIKDAFARGYSVPFILLTGMSDRKIDNAAMEAGASDYLNKDEINPIILERSIRYAISRAQNERLLIESKNYLSNILSSMSDILIVISSDLTIQTVNKSACGLLGYSEDDLIGMSFEKLLVDEQLKNSGFQNFRGNNSLAGVEIHFLSKEKKAVPARISSAEMIDGSGKAQSVIIVAHDISARKRMEEELLKSKNLESVAILAGGIAHDFNNLLTVIIGNVNLVLMDVCPEDDSFEILKDVQESAIRAKDLTSQLLAFSKNGAPEKKRTDVGELIKSSANFYLKETNIRGEFAISDDLWLVEIDEGQISQVINNLLANAEQAMPDGGIIEISADNVAMGGKNSILQSHGRYVMISIKDHGTGISDDHLPMAFDPYYTTKQKTRGLGLAISYSIINKHKGHIAIKSKPGQGATIDVYLPASCKE